MTTSLQGLLHARLDRDPDHPALAFIDMQGRYEWQSLGDFVARAAAQARRLADTGLRAGDRCVLVLPSDESCAILLVATLLLGAVPLLIAPPSLQGLNSSLSFVLRRVVRTTRARVVVMGETTLGVRRELGGTAGTRILAFEEPLTRERESRIPRVLPASRAIAALQLTSGTTGFPRICVWKQTSLLAALDGMSRAMRVTRGDRSVNWTPLYHDMGLVNNFLLCLSRGVPLAMLTPTDFVRKPSLWLRGLSETEATVTWSPNFGYALAAERVKDEELAGVSLRSVRAFWSAAERIHPETMDRFARRFTRWGLRTGALKTNYGCAENVGGATFTPIDGGVVIERVDEHRLRSRGEARLASEPGAQPLTARIVSVGRPVPEVRVRIRSRSGRSLPDGRVGEIALRTPSRMSGYLGRPRETRRVLANGWLRTGDLGYLRDGEVFWVGRVRERITIRGRKLDPSDFERVLLDLPGLRPGCFVVFGVDDARHGTERVVVLAEAQEADTGTLSRLEGEVRHRIRVALDVTVDDVRLVPRGMLAKTSSGKRRHRHFRQLYVQGAFNPAARSA